MIGPSALGRAGVTGWAAGKKEPLGFAGGNGPEGEEKELGRGLGSAGLGRGRGREGNLAGRALGWVGLPFGFWAGMFFLFPNLFSFSNQLKSI